MTIALSPSASLSIGTQAFLDRPKRLFIGGEWVESRSGEMIPVLNPATEQVIAQVQAANADDVDLAVAAARRAFEGEAWSRMRPVDRERLLLRLADLLEANADEFAQLEALDNGKSVTLARQIDVALAIDFLRYVAGWATKIEGSVLPVSVPFNRERDFFAYTNRHPIGVVGQIIPWNFPLMMACWKIGPVLATGCTTILKPAEQTPLSALRLAELVQEAGYPAGVVNVITGYGNPAGAALAAHPGVDKVAFTGSTRTGKLLIDAARGNLKRLTLELGGKSPAIILPDADLDLAIPGAAMAIFFNNGQVCAAGSRLYVHRSIFDRVMAGVADVACSLKVGNGLEPDTILGPVVSQQQKDTVCGYLRAGLEAGAEALVGGKAMDRPGYFVEPTVFVNTSSDMSIVREEIFGPVVCAQPFDEVDQVIAAANDSPFGLAASLWTRDLAHTHRLASRLKAGTVWINCHTVVDAAMPFGGFKQSGWGRELGRAAIDSYTEEQSVCAML
ncbi:aldehyde dehydrogenase family protein [Insolitispirillum peregrinum]|uniref:aldehyde dehydrogenase family protein n=1 Tax=Insolitispirillum peregrinum TaxID=80876 RepID=UPI003619E36A